jgi:hypothetical protein
MHALPFPAEGGREREREGWCARTKGIGKKNEIKKFITLERIAEQVSFFYQMFFILPPITGSNLGLIRKTRLDQPTI